MSAPTQGYNISTGALPNLRIPNPLRLETSGNCRPFTIDHWYYLNALPSNSGLLTTVVPGSAFTSTGINLYLRPEAGAGYHFGINGTQVRQGNVVIGAWTHLAWVFTGTQGQLWQNGVQVLTGALTNGSQFPASPFWHSQFDVSTGGANCLLARVRFWDKALSSTEIAASRNAVTLPLGTADLLAEYRLDSGHGTELPSIPPSAQLLGNSSNLKTVSGAVLDDTGSAGQRTVRVYSRLTGALLTETLSSASTGAYSASVATSAEVNVVCLDDAGGSNYNDLILRTTPV